MKHTLSYNLMVLILFAVAHWPDWVESCTCDIVPYKHYQDKLCQAKIVAKVHVLKHRLPQVQMTSFEPLRLYDVKILKVFKGPKSLREKKKVTIKTFESDGFCGIQLEVGKSYIIGSMFLELCDEVQWKMDANEKVFTDFRITAWLRHCKKCQIAFCDGDNLYAYYPEYAESYTHFDGNPCADNSKDKDICTFQDGDHRELCYHWYGVCGKNMKGKCVWKQTKRFKACVKKTKGNK